MSDRNQGGIGLLFSGGLDSTLEAVERLSDHDSVHLLTFNNGCCVNMKSAGKRVEELRRLYGEDRIRFAEVDTAPLRRKLLHEPQGLLRSFKSPLVFDLACKMAAVIELIYYARNHGLTYIADGASIDQTQVFIQHPEFSAHIRPLFERYRVEMIKPALFHLSREEKIQRLTDLGFDPGAGVLEKLHITSQIAHQPFCLYGFVTFFFTSPLRHIPLVKKVSLPMERAKEAWDAVLPLAQRELDERLAARERGES